MHGSIVPCDMCYGHFYNRLILRTGSWRTLREHYSQVCLNQERHPTCYTSINSSFENLTGHNINECKLSWDQFSHLELSAREFPLTLAWLGAAYGSYSKTRHVLIVTSLRQQTYGLNFSKCGLRSHTDIR